MLHNYFSSFLDYCKNANFSERSIESLAFRLNEFSNFLKTDDNPSIPEIKYQQLSQFVADFNSPSASVKKVRVWTLRQFFHFLKLKQIINENIALQIPYPKIDKKVPNFLTSAEFKLVLNHFSQKATNRIGFRNLVIISRLGLLGLRTATVVAIQIEDVDLTESRLWIQEKGFAGLTKKSIILPQILCQLLTQYFTQIQRQHGPLFLSKRKQSLARGSIQSLFRNVSQELNLDKKLYPHLFRHTAATHLNQIAGLPITQFVLGHQSLHNTDKYAHLNPDIYAEHMRNHPYMKLEL
jgi:site-specific recombinase XerD